MIGYLKRAIWIFSLLFLSSLIFSKSISATEAISTSAVFSHTVKRNGYIDTTVTLTIHSTERTVLTYYTITIPQEEIEPQIYSISRNQRLEATVYDRTGSTDILLDLENTVIPKDGETKITISYTHPYENEQIINLTSEIIDTPTSKVSITYPRDWGEVNWISDQIEDLKRSDSEYILTLSRPDSSIVKLIFGQNVVYEFNISRSLNNPTDSSNQYEIIIPPDTEFQKILIDSMSIKPTQAFSDNSGNYILIFTLNPQEQKDIKINGYIIMGENEHYSDDINVGYDSSDIYWSLEDKQIEDIQEYLEDKGIENTNNKEVVLEYIYKYVIEKLTPSVSESSLTGGVRKGAIDILKSPQNATPESYTDLLKTLLTYYGIPSRYTIGYVSDISNYQANGMFHYWVQAYNGTEWVVLDPYLEDFSKASLFNREQLDHITLLNRIYDPISPTLTFYSDNDITFEYVNDSEIVYSPDANISMSLEPYSIINKYMYGTINIENTGNSIFTNVVFNQSRPNINDYIDSITSSSNELLLPHMSKDINFHIPFNNLEDDLIYSGVILQSGTKNILSESVSAEYSISARTGYEVIVKLISVVLFALFFEALNFESKKSIAIKTTVKIVNNRGVLIFYR